jgi:methylated-DNA-[protein]-cysteine S-methyltransferase
MRYYDVDSPVGPLCLHAQDGAIVGLDWRFRGRLDDDAVLIAAARQLSEYFDGVRESFDVPLVVAGSGFQSDVCAAMRAIPFGQTCTYGEIADQLGVTAQAVGQACGANPIPVLIPCHRVMGAGGKLTGFSGAGGVETKVALLRHEGAGGFLL